VEKVFLIDMKIIKSFEDAAFLALPRVSNGTNPINHTWLWGLGDDGEIYYKCTKFSLPNEWYNLHDNSIVSNCVSLKEMKKIVKEFGHLLVFI